MGDEHPDVATSLNNLAYLYDSQGRYREAEPFYLQALAICEQRLEGIIPIVLQCVKIWQLVKRV
ncbi:MAG: tetratricopeptide repeat protein [Gloeotrichia echinulata IR180]